MQALEQRVRSVLERHQNHPLLGGGDSLELLGIDADHIVQVRLRGPCASCPSTLMPLLMAIEQAIKTEVPEVRFVELVP